jgi:hypothetical protein
MEYMKEYNQFVQTSNPIQMKSSFLNILPCKEIEIKQGKDEAGNE